MYTDINQTNTQLFISVIWGNWGCYFNFSSKIFFFWKVKVGLRVLPSTPTSNPSGFVNEPIWSRYKVSFSDCIHCPSSVVVARFVNLFIVVVVVVNVSHFRLLLQHHRASFSQTWHKAFLGEGHSSMNIWRTTLFSKRRYYKVAKIHWQNFKIFFSRTTGPIPTKLKTNHPWVKGIQVYSNEGSHAFPRIDFKKLRKQIYLYVI